MPIWPHITERLSVYPEVREDLLAYGRVDVSDASHQGRDIVRAARTAANVPFCVELVNDVATNLGKRRVLRSLLVHLACQLP